MKLPITIDPRYHDAVIFDLDGALTDTACTDAAVRSLLDRRSTLARKLQGIGVATAAYSSSPHCQQALKAAGVDDLFDVCIDGSRRRASGLPESPTPQSFWRPPADSVCVRNARVVVEDSAAGVTAGRDGGFALVIGIDRTGHADELYAQRCRRRGRRPGRRRGSHG